MWKLKENTEKGKKQCLAALNSLNGVIPQSVKMKTAISCVPNSEYDAILISDFNSMEDLETYKVDSRHVKVSDMCKEIRVTRSAFDYEY